VAGLHVVARSVGTLHSELAGQRLIGLPEPDVPGLRIATSLSLLDEREAIALVIGNLGGAVSGHRKALASAGDLLDNSNQPQQLRLNRRKPGYQAKPLGCRVWSSKLDIFLQSRVIDRHDLAIRHERVGDAAGGGIDPK
jgi:hypothetical protein